MLKIFKNLGVCAIVHSGKVIWGGNVSNMHSKQAVTLGKITLT